MEQAFSIEGEVFDFSLDVIRLEELQEKRRQVCETGFEAHEVEVHEAEVEVRFGPEDHGTEAVISVSGMVDTGKRSSIGHKY
ncbi:UNVERIFIED_CONTAM: hypothetical protein K2H54_047106 [Gekko kuhli]